MATYNRWQNENLYGAADGLSDEVRKQQRGAFFGSIHGTLNHLVWGDQIWMSRFAGTPRPKAAGIPHSLNMYEKWEDLNRERAAFDGHHRLGRARSHRLEGRPYVVLGAIAQVTKPKGLLVTHMFNHQTHHRGQVHCMLTQCGVKPGATDCAPAIEGVRPLAQTVPDHRGVEARSDPSRGAPNSGSVVQIAGTRHHEHPRQSRHQSFGLPATAPPRARSTSSCSPRRIGRVRGAEDNSYTAGVICAKVARYAERVHHPDRLIHVAAQGAQGLGPIRAHLLGRRPRHHRRACSPLSGYGPGGLALLLYRHHGPRHARRHQPLRRQRYSGMYATICTTLAWTGCIFGTGRLAGPIRARWPGRHGGDLGHQPRQRR
jgi:uncharacterized damage-inducible protein DinB